jgi:hypothetical protein
VGWLDRSDARRQNETERSGTQPDKANGFLPFTTPGERVVSALALAGIAICSLLFGIVGGAIAFGAYALAFKLHEGRQKSRTDAAPDHE